MFSSNELEIIFLTIKVAVVCTVVSTPPALVLGWLLARKKTVFNSFLESVISLPLVAPPVVTGYLLLLILGRNGFLGRYIYELLGLKLAFNFFALVIASVIVSLPLMVRSVRAAIEMIDPAFEKASLTLGAGSIATFFRITLPMAFPGILSGMVLAFARSLGEFGATITLAGNIPGKTQTISLMIYSNMQVPGMERQVCRLMIISILISFTAILFAEFINKKKRYLKE